LLMDQDDPEKRIAELERQLAEQKRMAALQHQQVEASAQPQPVPYPGQGGPQHFGGPGSGRPLPAFPSGTGFGRPAQSGSQLRRLGMRLAAIAAVAAAVVFLGLAAYDFGAYLLGTPATATTQQCVDSTDSTVSCTGTWTVGGKADSGPIVGDLSNRYDISGKSLGVRVVGGRAYTPDSGLPKVYWGLTALLISMAIAGRRLRVWWRGQTRR
jgi:hypothetical protein